MAGSVHPLARPPPVRKRKKARAGRILIGRPMAPSFAPRSRPRPSSREASGWLGDRYFFVNTKHFAHRVRDLPERGVDLYSIVEVRNQVLAARCGFLKRFQPALDFFARTLGAEFPQPS